LPTRHIVGEFLANNNPAEHLDGTTSKEEREAILARLATGETKIVSNAMVLTEGWDCPSIGCCVLARPTKHHGLFRHMIGRALRPADGKTKAIIIDHAGAVYEHGKPEDRVEWTLDPDKKAHCPEHKKRCRDIKSAFIDCTQCGALRAGGLPCPECGFLPQRPKEYRPFIDEDLVEVGSTASVSQAEKQEFYLQLRSLREREHPNWSCNRPLFIGRSLAHGRHFPGTNFLHRNQHRRSAVMCDRGGSHTSSRATTPQMGLAREQRIPTDRASHRALEPEGSD
jgi:superfamily II DNA or RNA helicase